MAALPWLALTAAFSPVLVDLANYVQVGTEARYITLYPILLGLAARRMQAVTARPDGFLLVAFGLLLEMIGIAAGTASLARLGLPIAFVGLARAQGLQPLQIALLSLWLIPIPISIVTALSPGPESVLASLGAGVVELLGGDIEARGPLLVGPHGRLDLRPPDTGLVLGWVLLGIGWYVHAQAGKSFMETGLRSLRWGAAALLIQPLSITLAAAFTTFGYASPAREALTYLPWLVPAALAIYWTERGGAMGSPFSSR